MIARLWHGVVPISKSDEYLSLMRRIALPEYLATQGNRGAWCLQRAEGDAKHFRMLTFWDDIEAVKRFAGDDLSVAKYYGFDSEYLIEMEPHVFHYEVFPDSLPSPSPATGGSDVRGVDTIARVWRGVVPIEKAEAYFRYLADFGFRDYQTYAGNRGIHLLRRREHGPDAFSPPVVLGVPAGYRCLRGRRHLQSSIELIPEPYASMVYVAIYTGLRVSELAGLRWNDIGASSP